MAEHKIFDFVRSSKPRRSNFDLSHERKQSMRMGRLTPCLLHEVVPGDTYSLRSEILLRFAPLIAPVMHRINVYTHYFFIPNRILWKEWEDFITGGDDGTLQPAYPQLTTVDNQWVGSLADYMGLPVTSDTRNNALTFSALPFLGYNKVFNEYYRDQNLQAKVIDNVLDWKNASSTTDIMKILTRAYEKDYFTSALPYPQKGQPVQLPVTHNITRSDIQFLTQSEVKDSGGAQAPNSDLQTQGGILTDGAGNSRRIENIDKITGENSSITIENLRTSNRLQQWLEKQARGGSRYIETLLNHFGVRSSDARLQRPEYLGGGRQPVTISEVLNTASQINPPNSQDALKPVGDMSGHGISVGSGHGFGKKTFEEHGYILGIMSILPRTAYSQGVHKHWKRENKLDYYWPEFANLGEQEVKLEELFHEWTSTPTNGKKTWAYQSRYAEYKYMQDSVHGNFRDKFEFWHLGRKFANEPTLNEEFIQYDADNRIFAVQEVQDNMFAQIYHDFKARRPMPYFSDPRL